MPDTPEDKDVSLTTSTSATVPTEPRRAKGYPNLIPVTSKDDPRYIKMHENRLKNNADRKKLAENKKKYDKKITEFKKNQLDRVLAMMSTGEVEDPAAMLMELIKEHRVFMDNPELTPALELKAKSLYLDMYKQYVALTGANAPAAQSIDVSSVDAVSMSPSEIEGALLDALDKAKVVDHIQDD